MNSSMNFTGKTDIPDNHQQRYNKSPKRAEARKKYEKTDKARSKRKAYYTAPKRRETKYLENGERYMSREFVAWDGEGMTEEDGSHTYFMIANSLGAEMYSREGLKTLDVFDLFMKYAGDKRIHVGYGLGYDINMIVGDIPRDVLEVLYKEGTARWKGYGMEWRPGKSFALWKDGAYFRIFDVLPFFQRSFVSALDEYFGENWEYRDQIIAGKAARGSFQESQMEEVGEYNAAELVLLVRLVTTLRQRLFAVDLRISRWDGPGAIATALYKKYDTKSYMGEVPDPVAEASRNAYAGGRFELIRQGHSPYPAYQYDIRSAYPSAIATLPCLAHGKWTRRETPDTVLKFGMYRIEVHENINPFTQPQPLWRREKDGRIFYANKPHNWFWSPEAQLVLGDPRVTFHEAWEWEQECDHEPFAFVEALYNKRAALKKAGDGAHIGLKLGLNSLYGKLAQQIGWNRDEEGQLRIPPYHCLEWAGYVTAHCRSNVYRAAMLAPNDIIAFETDAVFSRVPLAVDIGERLGQWEATEYSNLTYLKSGMYYATRSDGREVEKARGINKGTLTRQTVIENISGNNKMEARQTRFITLGQALHQDFTLWRKWITGPKMISTMVWGKRIECPFPDWWQKETGDGWAETMVGFNEEDEFSHPYTVAWIDPDNYEDADMMDIRKLDYERFSYD